MLLMSITAGNFHMNGKVTNILQSCYWDTGVMNFGHNAYEKLLASLCIFNPRLLRRGSAPAAEKGHSSQTQNSHQCLLFAQELGCLDESLETWIVVT